MSLSAWASLLALWVAYSNAAPTCLDEDTTSLVQTKAIVHHSVNRSVDDDDEVTQDFDITLGDDEDDVEKQKYFMAARGVANSMIKAVWAPSSWKGSWAFNIKEECRDRHLNFACQQKARGDCFGDCQWLPHEKICKTPRLNSLLHFAPAGQDTPFSLYVEKGYDCTRRSKEECEGDGQCKFNAHNGFANCDSSPKVMKEVVMQRSFKVLVDRVNECTSLSIESCERYGCKISSSTELAKRKAWADGIDTVKGNKENPVFAARLKAAGKKKACSIKTEEFVQLAFGYMEGSETQKRIAAVIKNRQSLMVNVPREELMHAKWGSPDVIETRCGQGPWKEVCHKVMLQSWTCVNGERPDKEFCLAHKACSWAVFTHNMCDIGYSFLNENCPKYGPDSDGESPKDWKFGPPIDKRYSFKPGHPPAASDLDSA